MPDLIYNGQAHGSLAARLMESNFDVGQLRPFIGNDGRHYETVMNADGKPEVRLARNADATLRKDAWIHLDQQIVKAAQPELRLIGDLRSRGLEYNLPNGLGTTVLQTEKQSDINPATVSMDGLRRGEADRPHYDLTNLPIPIIHKDFYFSTRQMATAANSGSPLDTTMAELAARQVAEEAEKMAMGVSTVADQYSYGSGTIYGLTDFPSRITQSITDPTSMGWVPNDLITELLSMREAAKDAYHRGPYRVYMARNWDTYLDEDFSASKGSITLRERIAKIPEIGSPVTLEFLADNTVILVQTTSDNIRIVVGMEMQTVQWEEQGGMQMNFKVMAILVPQLRADYNSNCGIVHGS